MNSSDNYSCVGFFDTVTLECISWADFPAYARDYLFPEWDEWVLIALFLIVFVCGVIGNSLVCLVILRNSHMRTVTNVFIFNLAVADLLVLLIVLIPTMIQDIFESWLFGEVACPIIKYLQSVSVIVSVLTLTAISIERVYAVCNPLKFKSTLRRARFIIFFIWCVSLVSASPDLFFTSVTMFFPDVTVLLSVCDLSHHPVYYYFSVIAFFIVPCVVMAVSYTKIARVLWVSQVEKLSASETGGLAGGGVSSQLIQRRKTARMLIVVVVCFFCCFFIHHFVIFLGRVIPKTEWNVKLYVTVITVGHLLIYVSSATNPFIYNFMSEKFRMAFLSIFSCCGRNASLPSEQIKLKSSKSDQQSRDDTKVTEM